MDFCSLFCVLVIVLFSICLAIIFLADSDILTFICSYVGRQPVDSFRNKVVWITGASFGIGEGLAKEVAKCPGSKIVLSARREDELKRVKRECLADNPKREDNSILVLPLDMTDYSKHQPSFEKVLGTFGKLDVLVSNAGRSQRAKWDEIETEVDKQLFDLNVFSLVNLNRIVLRYFFKVGGGQLDVTSSIAGKIGAPNSGSYTASKFALHGYFESLRNEVRGKNVDVTMICPGPVFSGVLKEAFTSKVGEKVDQDHSPNDRRMTSERCGFLSLLGIANRLEEIWLAPFPIIPLTYLSAYQPFLFSLCAKLVLSEAFSKLRDNKDVLEDKKKE